MKQVLAFAALAIAAVGSIAEPRVPEDVSRFVERRESCDHWRSEPGYDKERQAKIDWAVCQSCPGADSELAHLKMKYKSDVATLEKLSEFEPTIEPANKAEQQEFCRTAKRPK